MIQTVLQITDNCYPFDEQVSDPSLTKVELIQFFQHRSHLAPKKQDALHKIKYLDNGYLVRLVHLYQDGNALHYIYEFVEHSLYQYIRKQLQNQKFPQLLEMTSRLLLKKLTCDINTIAAYLAKMRIQTDFSFNHLGVHNNKIKLFINPLCKIGQKSEIYLSSLYKPAKTKIIQQLELQIALNMQKEQTPNFIISGNKLIFRNNKEKRSDDSFWSESAEVNERQTRDSNAYHDQERNFSQSKFKHRPKSSLRHTQSPSFKKKMNFEEESETKSHKNSFQFCNSASKKKHSSGDANRSFSFDDQSKAFTHSKSIRIELQKKLQPPNKQRKDSYKMKITTFHEYQMDDVSPQDILFAAAQATANQDNFNFSQSMNSECSQFTSEQGESQNHYSSKAESLFARTQGYCKNKKEDMNQEVQGESKKLEQKIRQAKEKAQTVLSQYLKSKKKLSNY